MRAAILLALGTLVVLHGVGTTAMASATQVVPEISPASLSGGLAILAGGVLVLRARRRR